VIYSLVVSAEYPKGTELDYDVNYDCFEVR